jgi:hypothetical protein
LGSYFDFFEYPAEPIINTSYLKREDYYDWFRYKDLDAYSSTYVINDSVIITEVRMFVKMLAVFINSVANSEPELLEELFNGSCKRATGKGNAYRNAFSIRTLNLFVDALPGAGFGKQKKPSKKQPKRNKTKKLNKKSAKRKRQT